MTPTEGVKAIFMAIILCLDLNHELTFRLQSNSPDGIDRAICDEINCLCITIETDGNEIHCLFKVWESGKKRDVLRAGDGRPGVITKDAVAKLEQESYSKMAKNYAKTVYGFARSIATA